MNYPQYSRTAVVTGAASGIGRAIALSLARRGFDVGIMDIDMEGAQETLEMARLAGGGGEVVRCNVRDATDVRRAADHFFGLWGRVGMLVNNAGIGGGGFVGEITEADWLAVVETDYLGVVHCCQAFVPRMREAGTGHVVNIASTAGIIPVMGFAPYNTSKAAVISLSETMAIELAPHGISVTVVCPSFVRTNIVENSLKVVQMPDSENTRWGMNLIETAMARSSLTCEQFVCDMMRDVDRRRLYSVPKRFARFTWFLKRLAPSLYFGAWTFLSRHGLARGFIDGAVNRGLA